MTTGGQRGQSMVEFALVALIFFLFVFGIIQMGIVMEAHQTVARAANAAAKAVAEDVNQGSNLAISSTCSSLSSDQVLCQEELDAWTAAEDAITQGALAKQPPPTSPSVTSGNVVWTPEVLCNQNPSTSPAVEPNTNPPAYYTVCYSSSDTTAIASSSAPLTVDVVANNTCPSPLTSGSVGVQVTVEYLQPLSVPLISQFFGGRETISGGTYLPLVVTAENMPCG
ncbi:MAG: pilus assembly protein [Thermaerobacter sp.]|nr:pilus assembly protein [Thermaerobacter sp.]